MKWQWFLGGRFMFWVAIILFIIGIIGFVLTYVIDPTATVNMTVQKINPVSIKNISEKYVSDLGVVVDKDISYRFVDYKVKLNDDNVLLGTFHEWNSIYYIDISVNLYKSARLEETVIHETRHMLLEYLKDKKIINLDKYTEEIAEQKNSYYNNLFDSGVYLLKEKENK